MARLEVEVGRSLRSVADEVAATWKEAQKGHPVQPSDKIVFRDWDALCAVLTTQRYALLRTLHTMPRTSVTALSARLGQREEQVEADVAALAAIGLIAREADGDISATADEIASTIRIAS